MKRTPLFLMAVTLSFSVNANETRTDFGDRSYQFRTPSEKSISLDMLNARTQYKNKTGMYREGPDTVVNVGGSTLVVNQGDVNVVNDVVGVAEGGLNVENNLTGVEKGGLNVNNTLIGVEEGGINLTQTQSQSQSSINNNVNTNKNLVDVDVDVDVKTPKPPKKPKPPVSKCQKNPKYCQPKHKKPKHKKHKHTKYCKHRKGNNGLGNGVDPQPPGNPKKNDTRKRVHDHDSKKGHGKNKHRH